MLVLVLQFPGGLLLLLGVGESLVRGAGAMARGISVPPVAVGMTFVAFGTSAPWVCRRSNRCSDRGLGYRLW